LEPEFDHIEYWRLHPDEEIMVGPDLIVWRDDGGYLRSRRPAHGRFNKQHTAVDLVGVSGMIEFAGLQVTWTLAPWKSWSSAEKRSVPGLERFDADAIGTAIRLRHWRPADRFQPIGLASSVKVQDIFTNLKVPRARRAELVLAETAKGDIFWIEGVRISDQFKIKSNTKRVVVWSWQRASSSNV
jgi:tRNA(Ile)-lysidine synthetase-like protein